MANEYFNHNNPLARQTLARAEQVNATFQAVEDGFDKLPDPTDVEQGRVTYFEDTGTANSYAVTFDPALASYVEGILLTMKAANTNTGASTININGLGVKPIRRYNGDPLEPADIVAGMLVHLGYDGTNFRIIGVHGAETALARDWAIKTNGVVAGEDYSAKAYAVSQGLVDGGSAKEWANKADGPVDGEFSAKIYANTAFAQASAAETSAQNAQSLFESFRGIYYGALAGDPSQDPNGNPPTEGDWYFNTTVNGTRMFDGVNWGDLGAATLAHFKFTAAGGETSLSGEDDNGDILAYTVNLIQVYKNGVRLVDGDDFTADDGNSITGLAALDPGDIITIDAFSRIAIDSLRFASYETKAALESANVPAPLMALHIQGYHSPGDGGGALYKRVASEPSHAGKIQSADGAWWEIADSLLNIKSFGIIPGNTAAVNDPLFQNALNAAESLDRALYCPAGVYRFASQVRIPQAFTIYGDGMQVTIFDFTDSNGFLLEGETGVIKKSYINMRDFTLRGNGDESEVSSVTTGMRVTHANYGTIENIRVLDFVRNIDFRGTEGAFHGFDFENIHSIAAQYPNSVNGYPRQLVRIFDDTNGKPQACSFTGIVYGQVNTGTFDHTATSGQTDFVADWGPDGLNRPFDLYKETGLKVAVENAWGQFEKHVIGTDYDLYAEWDSVEYQIPPGTEYVRDYVRTQSGDPDARAYKFIVKFTSGLSAGDEVRLRWNDPTAEYGVYNDIGTSWDFDVQIGGCETAFYSNATSNRYSTRYAQICDTLFQVTSDADENVLDYRGAQGGTIETYLDNGGPDQLLWNKRLNRKIEKLGSDFSTTSESDVTVLDAVGFTIYNPVPRQIQFKAQYTLSASGTSARARVFIERSTQGDGGSANWTEIGHILLEETTAGSSAVTGSASFIIDEIEDDIQQGVQGRKPEFFYRVRARVLNADSTLTIQGGSGTQESTLRMEEIQP